MLALAMSMAYMPVHVLAEEPVYEETDPVIAEETEVEEVSLDEEPEDIAETEETEEFGEEAPESIAYLDDMGRTVYRDGDYTVVDGSTRTLESGFYVAEGNVTIEDVITVRGAVTLCLKNGSKLDVEAINVSRGNQITITSEPGMSGQLITGRTAGNLWNAGIGGGYQEDAGMVIINGGTIDAHAFVAAGIGGFDGYGGIVVINDGKVTASSEWMGAGIGCGDHGTVGTIEINGGTVKAFGGADGAGIGSGTWAHFTDSCITINYGDVYAKGGQGAAGIGAGRYSDAINEIHINGGNAEAVAGSRGEEGAGAAIGNCAGKAGGLVEITNASVNVNFAGNGGAVGDGELTSANVTEHTTVVLGKNLYVHTADQSRFFDAPISGDARYDAICRRGENVFYALIATC